MEASDVVGDLIRGAQSRPELKVIWHDARQAGTWTDVHSALAQEVSKSFAS
jgi:hypothetical protein